MITSTKQARAVQRRRVDAGKRGTAKAVRRFLNKQSEAERRRLTNHLPVIWDKPKPVKSVKEAVV